jgi:transglutaminase-like putative cysteine protease
MFYKCSLPFVRAFAFAIALCLAGLPATAPALRAFDWIAPTPEELSATASAIDPEAGAEILYRVRQIDDSEYVAPATDEYIRIKIFNDKGVQQFDKIDIEYASSERISSLEARVVKPNGSIINVEKKAFYNRDIVKGGDAKVRVRSFSFPRLAPGDIIEYKWCITAGSNILAARFFFLSAMPTRRAIFRLKAAPLAETYGTMAYFYKCDEQKAQRGDDDFHYIEMKNLPAFVSEPYMEPEQDVQPWMMFYPVQKGQTPREFWDSVAKDARARVERYARKPGKLVRETAARIGANAVTPEEKVARINDYCRANILNYWVYNPRGGLDAAIREKYDRSPDELIKTKLGNSDDIPVLFIALARSLGLDARAVLCSNRRDGTFKMELPIAYYLNEIFVAVKIDDKWCMYDPAHNMVSHGMLRWTNEGMPAMIVMPKGVEWVVTAQTPASRSVTKRTGNLRLNDEGTLFGDINIEYSGQAEITARHLYHNETDQKIEELVRESVQARLPNAEVSDVRVSNSDNVLKPLVLTYSIKAPGYAENTGQRFFIQPGFFVKGEDARFTESERKHNIFFKYGETCKDDVTIRLPAHFRLEEGSAPSGVKPGNWGGYDATISMRKSDNSILYKREFVFTPLLVPAGAYQGVKAIFDIVHNRDSHALTFKTGE